MTAQPTGLVGIQLPCHGDGPFDCGVDVCYRGWLVILVWLARRDGKRLVAFPYLHGCQKSFSIKTSLKSQYGVNKSEVEM